MSKVPLESARCGLLLRCRAPAADSLADLFTRCHSGRWLRAQAGAQPGPTAATSEQAGCLVAPLHTKDCGLRCSKPVGDEADKAVVRGHERGDGRRGRKRKVDARRARRHRRGGHAGRVERRLKPALLLGDAQGHVAAGHADRQAARLRGAGSDSGGRVAGAPALRCCGWWTSCWLTCSGHRRRKEAGGSGGAGRQGALRAAQRVLEIDTGAARGPRPCWPAAAALVTSTRPVAGFGSGRAPPGTRHPWWRSAPRS